MSKVKHKIVLFLFLTVSFCCLYLFALKHSLMQSVLFALVTATVLTALFPSKKEEPDGSSDKDKLSDECNDKK